MKQRSFLNQLMLKVKDYRGITNLAAVHSRQGGKNQESRRSKNQRPCLSHLPAPCNRRSWWRPALSHCEWGSRCTNEDSQGPLCGSSLVLSSQYGKQTRLTETCSWKQDYPYWPQPFGYPYWPQPIYFNSENRIIHTGLSLFIPKYCRS